MAANSFLIRLILCLLVVGMATSVSTRVPASASCGSSSGGSTAHGQAGPSSLIISIEESADGGSCTTLTGGSSSTAVPDPVRDSDLDAMCVQAAIERNRDPFSYCDLTVDPQDPPAITAGMVASALRRVDLPASELVVQPPGGETLVNFATNFYTESGEFTRSVRLLGRRVDLRIRPASFTWVFGDGVSVSSRGPGAAYPDLDVTHEYLRQGGVRPRVDTTYSARFRVDGGRWRDVDGTVTVAGSPQDLVVKTATPVLVGYR